MQTNVPERIAQVISEQLGIERSTVIPSAGLVADLGADSLDMVELAMALEDEFGIEVPDEEGEQCVTVADCIALANKLIGQ